MVAGLDWAFYRGHMVNRRHWRGAFSAINEWSSSDGHCSRRRGTVKKRVLRQHFDATNGSLCSLRNPAACHRRLWRGLRNRWVLYRVFVRRMQIQPNCQSPFQPMKSRQTRHAPSLAASPRRDTSFLIPGNAGPDLGFTYSPSQGGNDRNIRRSYIVKQDTRLDFEAVFNSLPTPFLVMDRDFTIVDREPGLSRRGRAPRDELIGINILYRISFGRRKPPYRARLS